jgi:hypothetical protein
MIDSTNTENSTAERSIWIEMLPTEIILAILDFVRDHVTARSVCKIWFLLKGHEVSNEVFMNMVNALEFNCFTKHIMGPQKKRAYPLDYELLYKKLTQMRRGGVNRTLRTLVGMEIDVDIQRVVESRGFCACKVITDGIESLSPRERLSRFIPEGRTSTEGWHTAGLCPKTSRGIPSPMNLDFYDTQRMDDCTILVITNHELVIEHEEQQRIKAKNALEDGKSESKLAKKLTSCGEKGHDAIERHAQFVEQMNATFDAKYPEVIDKNCTLDDQFLICEASLSMIIKGCVAVATTLGTESFWIISQRRPCLKPPQEKLAPSSSEGDYDNGDHASDDDDASVGSAMLGDARRTLVDGCYIGGIQIGLGDNATTAAYMIMRGMVPRTNGSRELILTKNIRLLNPDIFDMNAECTAGVEAKMIAPAMNILNRFGVRGVFVFIGTNEDGNKMYRIHRSAEFSRENIHAYVLGLLAEKGE